MSIKTGKNFLEGFGHLASSPASPEDGKEPNIGKLRYFECGTKLSPNWPSIIMLMLAIDDKGVA